MSNVYDDPSAVQVHITALNNTASDLSTNLGKCQIGIETDTGLLGHKDSNNVYHSSAPKSTLTAGQLTKCSSATTGLLADATNTDAEVAAAVTASHARSHLITSTSDHTSTATNGQILKADANGLPVDATNTDAQVANAVTKTHDRSHAITSTSDHTSSATADYILKADSNGLPETATTGKIGGLVNYSEFEADGTLIFNGTATVYNDVQFQISAGKVPAVNTPTFETFTTNTREYSFAVNDYIDLCANEVPHSWSESGNADFHLHITTKAANNTGANRFAKFTVYVAYANSTGTWSETPLTQELTIPNGTAALTLLYLDMGDIDLTGYNVGAELKATVKRIAATGGTEYSGNIFITQLGCHLIDNTCGSRSETTK